MADRTGQQLGNYRLTRLLGQGGFADVYLGEHVYLKTQAAIKILQTRLAHNDMEDFLKEARTIASLAHPHIVRIIDFGVEDNTPFLVMDYAPYDTLRYRHARGVSLPLDAIVIYVKQIASALQYAHDHKLIHRDVKPENMLIGRDEEILLSDFGIALATQSSRYQSTHEVVGTVAYMAPEQLQGKPQPASDQYALGIVVYEWLTGERPFHGSFAELCAQHMFTRPPPLREKVPTILPDVEHVVTTALAKNPNQRFGSIQAFATALEQAREGSVATLLFPPTELKQSESSFDATLIGQPKLNPSHGSSSSNSAESSKTVATSSSTTPVTQRGLSSFPETFNAQSPSSARLLAPGTVIPEQVHSSSSPRKKRKILVSLLLSVLAIVLIVVPLITIASVYGFGGRGGSSVGNGSTVTVRSGSTSSPNGVLFVPTGTATSALSPTSQSVPPTPTSTPLPASHPAVPTPTATPLPPPTPSPTPTSPPPTSPSSTSITLLGGISNLNGYCQNIGDTGASQDGNTAYDWRCITSGGQHVGISMGAACQWQYNNSGAVDFVQDYFNPYSWQCFTNVSLLGGISNLNGYCQSIGNSGASLDGNTTYDWRCVTSGGQHVGISMGAACQWQYSTSQSIPRMSNYFDPYSWQCWG